MRIRTLNRLTPKGVERLTQPGRYADGGGLYLQVRPNGRSWVFRYADRATGREREMGLGSAGVVTLARARELAKHEREVLAAGNDPLECRRRRALAEATRRARMVSFGQACTLYIEAHRAGWRNPKHAAQWTATLATYCEPIYKLPVAEIDTGLVLRCLQPEWATKTETLSRVRQRLEAVLSWATVRGFRQGDNPARWRGHLDKLLPAPAKVKKVEHRAALPYADMPAFMAALRERRGVAARALELQILTAARPGEACGAMWAEIDLDAALWTIPATRMKAGKEHRIPLSAPAVAMLTELRAEAAEGAAYVFPTQSKRRATAVTTAAALKIARSIRADLDAHGMRSTFRDWAAERTAYAREIVEAALAHQLKDKAEAAYFRSDVLVKRAALMRDWARYCYTPAAAASVTPIRRRKSAT